MFTVQLPFLIEKIYLKKKETTVFFLVTAHFLLSMVTFEAYKRIQVNYSVRSQSHFEFRCVLIVCLFVCRSPLISCYLKIYSRHQEPWLLPPLKSLTSFVIFLEPIKVVKMCLRLAFVNEAIVERSWRGAPTPNNVPFSAKWVFFGTTLQGGGGRIK